MPSTASARREPGDGILVKRVCEREDANRPGVAGNRDEVEGIAATTLHVFRNGAVGFIDWLDAEMIISLYARIWILLHLFGVT